ncbi:General receptor for phosphoinositides 1-associated scaffold protein [Larimichthys crocea]|uniref:Uncharacterized protein n=1 Tax=Larimichthys crocea TaxID=215358 RepID=A0ACD3RCI7_LARCR|nr:General receptor for phosphoinositides 1-associated scaffold protein [Larimichthys crocea]
MTFRRLKKVNSSGPDSGPSSQDNDIYFPSSKSDSCRTMDSPSNSSEVYNYKTLAYSGGTLPRNFKKGGGLQKWKPLTQTPEPQRKVVVLEKKEEETFGFEIQTYGLHHQDQNSVEMCTFVCKVHEDSPAQEAGLKVGDTIASVNETTVEGYRHKEIVQLIRACWQHHQQTLHEKWDEYRSLMVQEQRLVHVYESLESAGIYGSLGTPSPAARRALRGTGSTSSSASFLSTATEDDPLYQTCLYQADSSVDTDNTIVDKKKDEQQPQQKQQRLRPASELFTTAKTHLTRSASTRSYMRGSSSSNSGEKQGGFNSLQRKPKQKSFRRRLLKFIPGLNRPLEEEESKL